jgi:hypothetical protein
MHGIASPFSGSAEAGRPGTPKDSASSSVLFYLIRKGNSREERKSI